MSVVHQCCTNCLVPAATSTPSWRAQLLRCRLWWRLHPVQHDVPVPACSDLTTQHTACARCSNFVSCIMMQSFFFFSVGMYMRKSSSIMAVITARAVGTAPPGPLAAPRAPGQSPLAA